MSYKPLSFGTGGNVTFGTTGSQITASAPGGGGGGGAAISAAGASASNGTVVFSNANGVSFGMAGSTVTASHNGLTSQSAQAFSASGGSSAFQTLSFGNANGLTFSNVGGAVQASYTVPSTAGLLSAGITALGGGTNMVTNGEVSFVNSNGVSFGLNNAGPFAQMTASHNGLTNIKVSGGTSSANLSALTFSNSNGVSFGLNGSVITGSHNALTSQSNQAVSAANGSSTFQTLSFANSNGVSFSTGTQGFFASHGALFGAEGTGGSNAETLSRWDFINSNGVTFGLTNSTITASHNGITKGEISVTVAGSSYGLASQILFSNASGVSWGMGADSGIRASVGGTISALGNTTGTGSNVYTGSFWNVRGAGIASVGIGANEIVISVPSGGGGLTNINVSAGTTSQNLSAITFSNGSGVSFGLNGSVITASVNAGGAGPTMSMYPALPHAWATSSMYTGASTTVGGGSSSTLSFYMAPLVLGAAVTFNDVGAIIQPGATVAGSGSGTHRHVLGIYTLNGGTLSRLTNFGWNALHSQSSVTAQTLSWWAGDFAGSTAASTNRISGNVSASITGLKDIRLNASSSASSLSAGQYYLAHAYNLRSSSSALFNMGTAWRHSVSQFTGGIQAFGSTTGPLYDRFNGIVSTVTTSPTQFGWDAPASIHTSAISVTGGTSRNQWPLVILRSASA